MSFIDERFQKREKKYRRNYGIEDTLYTELEHLSKVYDASIPDLINASIEYLIETENVAVYEKDEHEIMPVHTVWMRESNVTGLENLKARYGVSIYKLVNIAIRNVLNEIES